MEILFNKVLGKTKIVFIGDKANLEKLGIKEINFEPNYLSTFFFPKQQENYIFVGTGNREFSINNIMELIATGCKGAIDKKINEFSIDLSNISISRDKISSIVKTVYLALGKKFTAKTNLQEKDYKVGIFGYNGEYLEELKEGITLGKATQFARDIVNMPSNYLYPESFAKLTEDFCRDAQLEVEVLHLDDLRKKGFGGILAVGESSAFPPCLTIIRYMGNKDTKEITGLVGKGVTVDTGGYCLKPSDAMMGIRGDMAGGAAVIGAIYALSKAKAKCNVVALVPMCENRISNNSYVNGDIITSYSKKTIEVCNTDAEGRIILADTVSYGIKEEKITRILDIATLTGAVVGMFGFTVAGVVSNNMDLWKEFKRASIEAGEKHWLVPYEELHEKMLESDVADIKNVGGNICGTVTAALFIKYFTENLPWIHIDIAGTAWVDNPVYAYQEKYATGVDVATIYRWLR